jgi:hypothetical protein
MSRSIHPERAVSFATTHRNRWRFPAGANQVMATLKRISVPYNHELASLEEVLKGVQQPGD